MTRDQDLTLRGLFAQLETWARWPRSAGAFQGMLIECEGGNRLRVTAAQTWQRGWVPAMGDPATQGVLVALAWGATGTMPPGNTPGEQAHRAALALFDLSRFQEGA
jgi:cell wall assembly regulator SMI1